MFQVLGTIKPVGDADELLLLHIASSYLLLPELVHRITVDFAVRVTGEVTGTGHDCTWIWYEQEGRTVLKSVSSLKVQKYHNIWQLRIIPPLHHGKIFWCNYAVINRGSLNLFYVTSQSQLHSIKSVPAGADLRSESESVAVYRIIWSHAPHLRGDRWTEALCPGSPHCSGSTWNDPRCSGGSRRWSLFRLTWVSCASWWDPSFLVEKMLHKKPTKSQTQDSWWDILTNYLFYCLSWSIPPPPLHRRLDLPSVPLIWARRGHSPGSRSSPWFWWCSSSLLSSVLYWILQQKRVNHKHKKQIFFLKTIGTNKPPKNPLKRANCI